MIECAKRRRVRLIDDMQWFAPMLAGFSILWYVVLAQIDKNKKAKSFIQKADKAGQRMFLSSLNKIANVRRKRKPRHLTPAK